ncbi:MAG: hypothetical protein ACTSYB_12040, partial [Candidatus Helarchaeota archaeon]
MIKPIINYKSLVGKSRDSIIEIFLNQISYDDEENTFKRTLLKKTKPLKRTHLKIIIIKSYGLNPEEINNKLDDFYFKKFKSDKLFREFVDNNRILLNKLNTDIYHLEIIDKHSKRHFHFVIFLEQNYWITFTLVKKEDLYSTIGQLIKYFPELEYIKLTPRHLEDLAKTKDFQENVRGFIAKYKPKYKERNITVNVFGGSLEDLDKLRETFFVEPFTINFGLQNSPLVDAKIFSDGHFTIEKIHKEGFNFAKIIIEKLKDFFIKINEDIYEKVEKFENVPFPGKRNNGLILRSSYCLVIKVKKERFEIKRKDSIDLNDLNEQIIKFFKNRNRYIIYSIRKYSHFVLDKKTRNKIQLTIE